MWQSHAPGGATRFGGVIGKDFSSKGGPLANFGQDDISVAQHQVQCTPAKSSVSIASQRRASPRDAPAHSFLWSKLWPRTSREKSSSSSERPPASKPRRHAHLPVWTVDC